MSDNTAASAFVTQNHKQAEAAGYHTSRDSYFLNRTVLAVLSVTQDCKQAELPALSVKQTYS